MTSLMTLNQHEIGSYATHARLNIKTMGEQINRIPGLRNLISSLPGSASRRHVESLCKPCDVNCVLKVLPGKLDMERHSPSIVCFNG